MKALGNEVPTHSDVIFKHPGKWFAGVFEGLSNPEKVGWLKLLSLALITCPPHFGGTLYFCSEKEICSLLDIDEKSLIPLLKKAKDLEMIYVGENGVMYRSAKIGHHSEEHAENPAVGQHGLFSNGSWFGAKYKLAIFMGIYHYNIKPLEWKRPDEIIQEELPSQFEEHEFDKELVEPLKLLQGLLAESVDDNARPSHIQEGPFCRWWEDGLPSCHIIVPDIFGSLDDSIKLTGGRPLWAETPKELKQAIFKAEIKLEDWFTRILSRSTGISPASLV